VESVAWISERKDVMSALFWMLTLCLYVYYTEKPAVKRYLLVLLGFVLALMSKPMVVTLPVVMILLDYWPLKRFELKKDNWILWQLKEKMPFFILSAVFSIMTVYAHQNNASKIFPLVSRLANAPVAFVTYLEKTFIPHDMAVLYPFTEHLPLWQVIGTAMLILVITTFVIAMAKRLPYLFVGWLWFAITITPVIGIIKMSMASPYSMADRYHYLPSIGIAIILAWGIPTLFKTEELRKKILFPTAIAVLAMLAILTWRQCSYWKNSSTLFSHVLRVTKNNYIAHSHLGYVLFTEGKINEAIDHYNKAINIKSDYAAVYNNRGAVYYTLGQYQQAVDDYNMAIRLQPDYIDAYNNRGAVYYAVGQYQRAIYDYDIAIYGKPDYVDAYFNRGIVLAKLNQYNMAILNYNKVIQLNPNDADAYKRRGAILLNQGRIREGCLDVQKACELGQCDYLKFIKGNGYCR
jgi:tetratricopeptide (TPR) repeat protein